MLYEKHSLKSQPTYGAHLIYFSLWWRRQWCLILTYTNAGIIVIK